MASYLIRNYIQFMLLLVIHLVLVMVMVKVCVVPITPHLSFQKLDFLLDGSHFVLSHSLSCSSKMH